MPVLVYPFVKKGLVFRRTTKGTDHVIEYRVTSRHGTTVTLDRRVVAGRGSRSVDKIILSLETTVKLYKVRDV